MKCDFCGFEFEQGECKSGCKGCPMSKGCSKIKCPNCNYEIPKEPEFKFLKNLMQWSRKLWAK